MVKSIALSLLFFHLFTNLSLGQGIGTWQSFSSKKEIVAVTSLDDNHIWCATTGGAFMFENSSESFLQLGTSDGLSNPLLTSVAADKLNQIWFGTQLGAQPGMLNVYNFENGLVRKINDIINSNFAQKNINQINVSGDTVLVSTAFGLSLINPNNYSFYDTFIKFGDFPATISIKSSAKFNRFFVITNNGVAVQKINSTNLSAPESWDSYFFGSGLPANNAYALVRFNNDILIATSSGVLKFENNSWQPFVLSGIDARNIATSQNELYITSLESGRNKIYKYSLGSTSVAFENAENFGINDIHVTASGIIFAATNSGLLKIQSNSYDLIVPDGPANNAFLSLAADNNGELWVGTGDDVYGIGVMHFNGINWDLLSRESNPEIITNSYHKVYAGSDNTKYFCNWGRGLTVLKDNVITNYTAQNSNIAGVPADPTFLAISDVKTDSKGNIWVVNHQSAERKPLSVITTSGDAHGFEFKNPVVTESDLAYHLEIDQYDTKWFAITVGNVGLYYFNENGTINNPNDDKMGLIRTIDGLVSNSISALALDQRGALWVGTNLGVSIIPNPSTPTSRITTVLGLRQQTITDIKVDPLNQKWVGTMQGLFHLSEDGTVVINSYNSENSPLPSNEIKSIAVDGVNGIVYVGTDFGLSALKTTSVSPRESFDELFIYPNPVKVSKDFNQNITIEGLIANSSIRVLSITGKLVREIVTPGGRIAFWDGKDMDGNFVASGIYLIVAYDEDGSNVAKAKVAILRE
ncbi:hypothetical protein ASZ90_005366 [hydrocarbon metagenome]|uniref:PorZ N-terminal beta-propeller domain-containing protein n=1 Tax=hydrocarbon metagenome TaxID=938273 RepID=A0A0W8FVD6_9ZZZZ